MELSVNCFYDIKFGLEDFLAVLSEACDQAD